MAEEEATDSEVSQAFLNPTSPSPSSFRSSNNGTPIERRFNSKIRQEIQLKIDQNQCTIKESEGNAMNSVLLVDKVIASQCQFCLNLFSTKSGSSIRMHIESCLTRKRNQIPYALRGTEKRELNLLLAELVAFDAKSFSSTQTVAFKKYTEYCVNLGFKVGRHLQDFTSPENFIPCRSTIKNTLRTEVEKVNFTLKEVLQSRVDFRCAVILDFTTLKYNYLGVAIHFLDNWELKVVLLCIQDWSLTSSTSENIRNLVNVTLQEYGIDWTKNFVMTDEGANVVAAFRSESASVCIPHTLNTIMKRTTDPYKTLGRNQVYIHISAAMKSKLNRLLNLIKILKSIIKSAKHSSKLACEIEHPLIKDCDTRWLSKLSMIESWLSLTEADKNKLAEHFLDDEEKTSMLTDLNQGFGDLQNYVTVMGIFRPTLRLLESEITPTVNHVLISYYKLYDHLKNHQTSNNELIKALATSCLAVLERKKNNFTGAIHYAACCIDVFQRNQIFLLRGIDEVNVAQQNMKELFEAFVRNLTSNVTAAPESDEYAMVPGDLSQNQEQSIITAANNELESYYRYRPTPDHTEKKDVLQFWNSLSLQFPLLSKFANFVLAIPASSASIERINSVLTRTVSKDRRSLDPMTVSDLLLLKSFMKCELS